MADATRIASSVSKLGATRLQRWLIGSSAAIVFLYLIAIAVIGVYQRAFIYHPWSNRPVPPAGFEEIRLTVAGDSLAAWFRPATPGRPTIVFFDGNGGALAGATEFTRGLAEVGFGLLLVSYPGYDGNPGQPTEESLYATGRAALSWMDGKGLGSPVLLGFSLGTGVATQMALERQPRALVLLAPYASMTRMVGLYMPFLPAEMLLLDRFDSIAKIGRLSMPLLVVHGDADPVIPIREGRRLFDAANAPKRFVIQQGGGHVLDMSQIVPQVEQLVVSGK